MPLSKTFPGLTATTFYSGWVRSWSARFRPSPPTARRQQKQRASNRGSALVPWLLFVFLAFSISSARAETQAKLSCEGFIKRIQGSAGQFNDLLPAPEFSKDRYGRWKAAENIKGIASAIICDDDQLEEFNTVLIDDDQASQIRYSLWIVTAFMATSPATNKDRAFAKVQQAQNAALRKLKQQVVRTGQTEGCARIISGAYRYEYAIQHTTLRIIIQPTDDRIDECAVVR